MSNRVTSISKSNTVRVTGDLLVFTADRTEPGVLTCEDVILTAALTHSHIAAPESNKIFIIFVINIEYLIFL